MMTLEHLLRRADLPRPDVTVDDAADIASRHYGLWGAITELGSQQDRNYRIDTGSARYVLKVCRADYATVELEAQNAAMRHIRLRSTALRVPGIVPAADGCDILPVTVRGETCQVRLLEYLDGEPLTRRRHLSPQTVAALGRAGAELAAALSDFDHPGLVRDLQWDLRRAGPVALHLLSAMKDIPARNRIADAMVGAVRRIQVLAPALRLQATHQDVTDDNVVCRPDDAGWLMPDGIIDFGDIMTGWLAADLAVTCASLLHHADGDPFFILPAITAFHARLPLTKDELHALWPLIVARAGVLVASSEHQLAIEPDNAYVAGNIGHERAIFDVAVSVPFALMEEAILRATGTAPARNAVPETQTHLFGEALHRIHPVDLGLMSPDLSADEWMNPDTEALCLDTVAAAAGASFARYGEYRLTRSRAPSATAPECLALHVELRVPAGLPAHAPFAGKATRHGERLLLTAADGLTLHLTGLSREEGDGAEDIEPGDVLGIVAGNPEGDLAMVRVQLCRDPAVTPPLFARPAHGNAWMALCPSPASLLGMDCDAPALENEGLMARREAHFARPQKNYYSRPPQIERGWKEHLLATDGRAYLDMVNNVAMVGHGHPRLASAVGAQWGRLNTNSRFHYASVAEFSERLAGLAPEGLDTVFLVNSGSEAVDLALRLAWAASGARNMLCLLEAYHGWTVASDAVSTSIADNPNALSTRPPWVHPVLSPNTYRGHHRGAGASAAYVAAVGSVLDQIDASGDGLAGIVAESVYGNAGGIVLPPGYLAQVYEMVRARGGLCIADEVQVGYGRLGHHFWGFEQQGVVPDIITIAKGMGNGQPLGAVITSRAIADAFEKEGYFFSSSGGSPVSCVVGQTVLDILRDEHLMENARTVGDHLKARLEALGQRFAIVGAVHGMGLYLGLEFVRDRETLEPATGETMAICDRLLDLGVIMQPTGDHLNVLKIKPPLCLSRQSADFFADMLERVLEEGW